MGRVTGVFADFDDDDFAWWITRARDRGTPGRAHRTLGYRDPRGVNAWFAARSARHEIGAYAADLELAWEMADKTPSTPESLGLRCRYALLRTLLGDLGSRIPPALSATLVHHEVWTRDQALAWAELSFGEDSLMQAVADAISDAQGIRREQIISRVAVASGKYITEAGPAALAGMAGTAAPHEIAQLLEVILTERDKGGQMMGLRAIAPFLPGDLLTRVRRGAATYEAGKRAEALLAIVQVLPAEQQPEVFADIMAAAREDMRGGDNRGLLDRIAEALPLDRLGEMFDLTDDAQKVLGTILVRYAAVDPDAALRHIDDLDKIERDRVFAAAAEALAKRGGVPEAASAAGAIGFESARAKTIKSISAYVVDVEVEASALIEQIGRLSPWFRMEALRVLGERADGPSASLLSLAGTFPEKRDRARARAAVAGALSADQVAATLSDLLIADTDADALGHLAPFLDTGQIRRTLDHLAGDPLPVFRARDVAALTSRLVTLGHPDEALERTVTSTHPVLDRPTVLAILAAVLPTRLLPDAAAAVAPAPVERERVAARTALAPHLPPGHIGDLASQADALPYLADRAAALAAVAAVGVAEAQSLLARLLREAYRSRHVDRLAMTRTAAETVASGGVTVSDELVAATDICPRPEVRAQALLTLACAGSRTAAEGLMPIIARLPEAGRPHKNRTGVLAGVIVAVPSPQTFALAVVVAAPISRARDLDRMWRRSAAMDDVESRLLALSALSDASPRLAAKTAKMESARQHSWAADRDLLPLGLELLSQGGLRPDPELIVRAWDATAEIRDPAKWTAHVTSLTAMAAFPPEIVDDALRLPAPWLWSAVVGLAPRMSVAMLTAVLDRLRESGESAVALAAASCAVRGAELGEYDLMMAFLDIDVERTTVSAASRLPLPALGFAARHTDDQDALGAIAERAAAQGDRDLAREALARISFGDRLRQTLLQVIPHLPWRDLLPALDGLRGGERAEVLAALVARQPRRVRDRHLETAVRAAYAYRGASAHARRRILEGLERPLGELPPERLACLWTWAMHQTGTSGRDEVLTDVAAFAKPLIRVFGDEAALALDDAIATAGTDSWRP
jgi:hypothetical protein